MTERSTNVERRTDDRDSELLQIVRDAVEHVLARPDGRRGPYKIHDDQLRAEIARA